MKIDLVDLELEFIMLIQDYSENLLKLSSLIFDEKPEKTIKI